MDIEQASSCFLIALMGPTASGKTRLAIELANHFKTEIISVDARQFYREMNIGTAKPSPGELAAAKHHFIDSHSIAEEYTAGRFASEAKELLGELFKNHPIVIAAGGSTLYFRAFLEGMDELPQANTGIRNQLNNLFEEKGIPGLQEKLHELDPVYYSAVDQNNPRRLMRALEVCMATEKPYSSFLGKKQNENPFNVIKIGLAPGREELYDRINKRCGQMLEEGLLDEVKALYPKRHLTALQTVGYTEFFDYLDGKLSFEEAVKLFKQHTRNYAKRQMTWLRKENDIHWFRPEEQDKIIAFIESEIKKKSDRS